MKGQAKLLCADRLKQSKKNEKEKNIFFKII
jgi:hypothetical protein